MDLSFFSRPPGLWLATPLGVAALLLGWATGPPLELASRAVLRVKVTDGQEGAKVLLPGQDMEIRVSDRAWRLTLRRILASSVLFSLHQAKN